jgi:hypothetical protein
VALLSIVDASPPRRHHCSRSGSWPRSGATDVSRPQRRHLLCQRVHVVAHASLTTVLSIRHRTPRPSRTAGSARSASIALLGVCADVDLVRIVADLEHSFAIRPNRLCVGIRRTSRRTVGRCVAGLGGLHRHRATCARRGRCSRAIHAVHVRVPSGAVRHAGLSTRERRRVGWSCRSDTGLISTLHECRIL